MMQKTYDIHAEVCAEFYRLSIDSVAAARFIWEHSRARKGESALFVGGMFDIAARLAQLGLDVTVVDYSSSMVEAGRRLHPQMSFSVADLRSLPYRARFDIVYVVGRVFTHLLTKDELHQGLSSCYTALVDGGRLFFDNYEDTLIQQTDYFNGEIVCRDETVQIRRSSKTTLLSQSPYIVRWDARYTGSLQGSAFDFTDSMEHRAFSRSEVAAAVEEETFRLVAQGANFDDTSFFTLAAR